MTFHDLSSILIAVAVLAWILVRQFRWQPVDPSRIWRMPLVLAGIGVYFLSHSAHRVTGAEAVMLVLELAVAGASGALLGRIAALRPLSEIGRRALAARRARKGKEVGSLPTHESRVGGKGLVVWIGLLALRLALALVGSYFGVALAAETGVIYLVIATNRAGRAVLLAHRLGRAGSAAPHQL